MTFARLALISFLPHEYASAARSPAGGFRFLAKWLVVVTLLSALATAAMFSGFAREAVRQVDAMGDFGVKEKRFFYDGPQPFRADHRGLFTLVIDTTGKTSLEAVSGAPQAILVMEDRIITRDASGQRELRFAEMGDLTWSKADFIAALRSMPFVGFLIYAGLFVWWLLVAWGLTGFGGSIAVLASEGTLSSPEGVRLACHAFAVPMAIGIAPWSFPGLWLAVLATGLLLTWVGAKSIAKAPPQTRPEWPER